MSPDWILTAAHCVEGDIDLEENSVQYGSTIISRNSDKVVGFKEVIVHEKYDGYKLINDIAVVRVSPPIDMGQIENRVKLPIPNQYFPTGTPAVLAGWGRNGTGEPIQDVLQKAHLMVFESRDCRILHEGKVYHSNICAGVWGGGKGKNMLRNRYESFGL